MLTVYLQMEMIPVKFNDYILKTADTPKQFSPVDLCHQAFLSPCPQCQEPDQYPVSSEFCCNHTRYTRA